MATHQRMVLEALRKWKLVEGPLAETPKKGVIVKTSFAGICHTDVHLSYRQLPNLQYPIVLGHEIDGIIQSVGSEVNQSENWKVGDRVIVYPWGYCMECDWCKADSSTCPNAWLPTGKGPVGSQTYGLWKDGGYQNYVLVENSSLLVRVPDEVAMDTASLIPCSGITSYNACQSLKESVTRSISVKGHAKIGVIGCGGLCLWGIQIAKALYDNITIVAIDVSEEKFADAKEAGADITHCWPKEGKASDVALGVIKAAGGTLDAVIDYTGMNTSLERAYYCLDIYGTLTMVGLAGDVTPNFPLIPAIFCGIIIRGNMVGTKAQCEAVVELVQQGKVKGPPIEHVTLNDVERIIDLLHAGKQRGRAAVKF